MNLRIGHGYDVHRLVPGRALILGGSGTAVRNCYNAGTVPSGKKALLGNGSATVENCYYLARLSSQAARVTRVFAGLPQRLK